MKRDGRLASTRAGNVRALRRPRADRPSADGRCGRLARRCGARVPAFSGSIPCATLAPDAIAPAAQNFRENTPEGALPHLNFFTTHDAAAPTEARQERWMKELAPYYKETGATPPSNAELVATNGRASFDEAACAAVEAVRPDIVSFHFGLPEDAFLDRVRATGASVWCTATTVAEAKALSGRVDVIIAQGAEAGGHRGSFLGDCYMKPPLVGTMALVPQVVDAVSVPVIAGRGHCRWSRRRRGPRARSERCVGGHGVPESGGLIDQRRPPRRFGITRCHGGDQCIFWRPARGSAKIDRARAGPSRVPEFPWATTAVKPLAAADPGVSTAADGHQAAAISARGPRGRCRRCGGRGRVLGRAPRASSLRVLNQTWYFQRGATRVFHAGASSSLQ